MMGGWGPRRTAAVWIAVFAAAVPASLRAQEPARLEPIVVTATRIEQKVSEQAAAVSVVTRSEIEERMPLVAGDVLRDIPGIDVQRSGSAGSREDIKIRGGLGSQTLVLIDGFPVNSPTLGEFDISSLPVDDFERIEVVRGAQSALFGSNAMGGVVNFVPRKGRKGKQFGAGTAGGSGSTLTWKGFAQGAGDRGNLHVGGSGFESDGILPNDGASVASVLGSGEARTGGVGTLHGIVMVTHERKGVPVDFGTPRDANHHLSRRGLLVGARWELFVSDAVTLTASGSVFDERFHEADPADPGEAFPFVFDDLTRTRKTTVGLQARVSSGRRSTTFLGVEYQKNRGIDDLSSGTGDTHLDASTGNRSVYLQEELRIGTGTGVSLGVRVDGNSEAGTEVNPKVAVYQRIPGTGVRLRAAAGRGFRVPTVSEKSDPFVGNAGLSPEVAVSWEVGADATFFGRKGRISATWFNQDFRDLIQFDASVAGPAGFGQLRNVGRAFSRGVEAEAKVRLSPAASVLLTYTYSNTWDAVNRRRILGIPTQRGTLSLLVHPSPKWEGRIDWRLESDQLDAPPNGGDIRRPGYARVDLFGRYRCLVSPATSTEIDLVGKVQNVLARKYEERKGFPSPGFHFLLGAEMRI